MKIYIFLSSFLFISGIILSQQLFPSILSTAGNYYTNVYSSMSVTIGETTILTIRDSSSIIITQGFQQSKYIVSVVEEIKIPDIEVKIFPNPVLDLLKTQITGMNEDYRVIVSDANGRILLNNEYKKETFNFDIDFTKYAFGTYFIRITSVSGDYSKTFNIEKVKN